MSDDVILIRDSIIRRLSEYPIAASLINDQNTPNAAPSMPYDSLSISTFGIGKDHDDLLLSLLVISFTMPDL